MTRECFSSIVSLAYVKCKAFLWTFSSRLTHHPGGLVTLSVTVPSPWLPACPRPDGGREYLITVATCLRFGSFPPPKKKKMPALSKWHDHHKINCHCLISHSLDIIWELSNMAGGSRTCRLIALIFFGLTLELHTVHNMVDKIHGGHHNRKCLMKYNGD